VPYIGKQLVRGQNRKLDDISSGFNGSQTTFTLQIASQNVSVGSALQLWISVGGVIQNPLTDFTIAGSQITFTTAPAASLDFFGVIQGDVTDTNTPGDATVTTSKLSTGLTVNLADGSAATSSLQLGGTDSGLFSSAADKVNVTTGGVERLEIGSSEVVFNDGSNDVDFRVESNGQTHMLFVDGGNDRVGIGTSSPTTTVDVNASQAFLQLKSTGGTNSAGIQLVPGGQSQAFYIYNNGSRNLIFEDHATERLRVDSSGRLLVGTSTSPTAGNGQYANIVIQGYPNTPAGAGHISLQRGQAAFGANNQIGLINFGDNTGASYAGIECYADADSGTNDYPGRLVFSSTADGASSPTERMRILSDGTIATGGLTATPGTVAAGSYIQHAANAGFFGNNGDAKFGSSANNPVLFQVNGSEKARIDTSGRLLVGTSSARANFNDGTDSSHIQLEGTTQNTTTISAVRNSNSNGPAHLVLGKSRGAAVNSTTIVQSGDTIGHINFEGADGTHLIRAAQISAVVDDTPGANDMPGRLTFSTTADGASSPTVRMQIDRRGQIKAQCDGTPSTDHLFSTVASANATNKILSLRRSATAGDLGTGTECCVVRRNGDLDNTNNSYGSLSDVKLKENIVDANSQWEDLKQLQVRNYNFKAETGHQTHTQLGLIAQEVELVSPGLVKTTPDLDDKDIDLGTTTKSLNYSVLYMKAVKALQESMERIETLEQRLSDAGIA
jgi:hypothetical protein